MAFFSGHHKSKKTKQKNKLILELKGYCTWTFSNFVMLQNVFTFYYYISKTNTLQCTISKWKKKNAWFSTFFLTNKDININLHSFSVSKYFIEKPPAAITATNVMFYVSTSFLCSKFEIFLIVLFSITQTECRASTNNNFFCIVKILCNI